MMYAGRRKLTVLTSSKLSSYCPATSLTTLKLRCFRGLLEKQRRAFPEIALALTRQSFHASRNELPSSNDPGLQSCFLPNVLLCRLTISPRLLRLMLEGSESRHRRGDACDSTTDEPTTDRAPTISSPSHRADKNFTQNKSFSLSIGKTKKRVPVRSVSTKREAPTREEFRGKWQMGTSEYTRSKKKSSQRFTSWVIHRERENLEREEVFRLLCKGGFWGDLRVFFQGV